MIQRTFDAAILNEIVNHPEVRPTCGGDGESWIDLTEAVAEPKNHAVLWEHGCFFFGWSAPQTYEVHIFILPEGRGKQSYRIASEGIAYIVNQGADHLWARIAKNMPHLRHYTASAGFKPCGTDTIDLGAGPVAYDLYQWRKQCPL